MVASTIVPVVMRTPRACKCRFTAPRIFSPSLCSSSKCRNLHTVVSSGAGSCPKSIPTNCLITGESYRASSTAGSDKLNHCCKKYIRSIRSTPTGGRPFPGFGECGSISAHNLRHGTTCSISSRNTSRRVFFVYRSKPFIVARVLCCLFVDLIWRQLTLYSCGKGDLIQSLPRNKTVRYVFSGHAYHDKQPAKKR